MNDWVIKWMNEWMNEWMIKWMNEWLIEWVIKLLIDEDWIDDEIQIEPDDPAWPANVLVLPVGDI